MKHESICKPIKAETELDLAMRQLTKNTSKSVAELRNEKVLKLSPSQDLWPTMY